MFKGSSFEGGQAAGSLEPLDCSPGLSGRSGRVGSVAWSWSYIASVTWMRAWIGRGRCRSLVRGRVSTHRLTVLGSQPVRAASRSWDRFRAARAVRSSRGVRTGNETSKAGTVLGAGTVLAMAHAPKAKARTKQKPMKANAAIRSKTARAASNMFGLFQVR